MKRKKISDCIYTLVSLFFMMCILSCSSSEEEGTRYFKELTDWVAVNLEKPEKIKKRVAEELEKYNETGDKKFLIASKLTATGLHPENKKDNLDLYQMPLIYDILRINDGQYRYITVVCNFNLAFKFEHNSPKLAMEFLDKAIAEDEKGGRKFYLPHLYHFKGRLYYNKKDYKKALIYFDKALKTHDPKKDQLYIASMHNNFALCYDKMNHADRALRETDTAIKILENIQKPALDAVYFLAQVKVDRGYYQYKLKDYEGAEQTLAQELEFYKKHPELENETIVCLQRLFNVYKETKQIHKFLGVLDFTNTFGAGLKKTSDKVKVYEIMQAYYTYAGNDAKMKELSYQLMDFHQKEDEEFEKYSTDVSNILNNNIIQNINQKFDYEISEQKTKNRFMFVSILLILIIFCFIFVIFRNKYKKDKELAAKEKIILQKTKTILENNIRLQEDKISNLHLNLNLKIETEKEFLEHIKKVKRAKNIDAEQTISDLFFKINNLIQIDKKNYDLINEGSLENKQFVDKLSAMFPGLTQQDLKYCVYFKLELSSKEISLLENITEGSARVYKTKIKTKMDLGKDTDLNSFLKTI